MNMFTKLTSGKGIFDLHIFQRVVLDESKIY